MMSFTLLCMLYVIYHLIYKVRLPRNADPHLLLLVFLPALIFESAFSVNFHIIFREFGQALLLAGPGVILNTFFTALIPRFIFSGYDWDWATSLLFGAIVCLIINSITDEK